MRAGLIRRFPSLTASCGAPLMKLPAGAGTAATDAADVIAQATAACRAVNTVTLEMAVRGSAGGHRLRGQADGRSCEAGVRAARSGGAVRPAAVRVRRDGSDASLLLPRDRRVLEHGAPPTCSKRSPVSRSTPPDCARS